VNIDPTILADIQNDLAAARAYSGRCLKNYREAAQSAKDWREDFERSKVAVRRHLKRRNRLLAGGK
jgi:hypothetical protein